MSSEHATEQVPLAEIHEGDTIQDPKSGQWFTVTRTADNQRVSLTSTQMATGRSSRGMGCTTATNEKVSRSIPGALSIAGSPRASSLARCESNRDRLRDRERPVHTGSGPHRPR